MTTLTFLLDFDNTLADNDRAKADQDARLRELLGAEHAARFWQVYEDVRRDQGCVDYLGTLQRYVEVQPNERGFAEVAAYLLGFPHGDYLYPRALEAVAHLRSIGQTAILSDGDPVYQPAKIARAGAAAAVDELVFVYAHKQEHLDMIEMRLPADRYVLVDDKAEVLSICKEQMGERLLTVHVRQGKYARQPLPAGTSPPDRSVAAIGDLCSVDAGYFLNTGR